jgi:YVTN family beta-propeller protein
MQSGEIAIMLRRFIIAAVFGFWICLTFSAASSVRAAGVPLPNGKLLATPSTGSTGVGSMPMNALSVLGGKYTVISDNGWRQSLTCVDSATGRITGSIAFATDKTGNRSNGLYFGLAAYGNVVYAAQGAASAIAMVQVRPDGSLTQIGTLFGDEDRFISGLAVDSVGNLYAVENEFDNVAEETDPGNLVNSGALDIFSLGSDTETGRLNLISKLVKSAVRPFSVFSPTNFPLAVAALADGSKVFVGSERDGSVAVIDTSDPTSPSLTSTITTGSHPVALLLSANQRSLYVANADADTISVIDTKSYKVSRTIDVCPASAKGFPGASPIGLALSRDQSTLYVALGDMNAVGVVQLASDRVLGYIPAGWYPSSVAATASRLVIVSAKGDRARTPNNVKQGPNGAWGTEILKIMDGSVRSISLPTKAQLAADTREVYAANRYAEIDSSRNAAIASIGISSGKITHVIYVIKENRTYDQVLGDLPIGNGDPALTLFGYDVTPNQHALAKRFVLLDNFFDCGDVSGEGWNWSTQSYANEYVIRNVPYNYSGRGRQYDFEGQNNGYLTGGFPAADPYGQALSAAFPAGTPPLTDVAESAGGHLWDVARAAGLTYRNYGFFLSFGVSGFLPDNYPTATGLLPAGHDLSGVSDIDFRRFDLDFPDSNAPSTYYAQDHNAADLYKTTKYGHYDVPSRYAEWQREFDQMIAADPTGAKVPALTTVRFMMDHTAGAASLSHSPRSDVADNDYAVGELVEHVSRSPIWKHTAIFIIEDDAQNGQDHVDAHRSTCFVVSPFIKSNAIDHTFYNTDSVLHSIELLLGLRPMSQYDAIATPILDFGSTAVNSAPYSSILPAESIISDINPAAKKMSLADPRRPLAVASDRMDFVHPDSAPANLLNTIVWKTVKGVASNPPAPKHTVFPASGITPISAATGTPGDDGD